MPSFETKKIASARGRSAYSMVAVAGERVDGGPRIGLVFERRFLDGDLRLDQLLHLGVGDAVRRIARSGERLASGVRALRSRRDSRPFYELHRHSERFARSSAIG